MLVKVRTIVVSMNGSLIELFVQMLRLLANTVLSCLQVIHINLYSSGFNVGREIFK